MEKLYATIFIVDISQNPDEVETITSRIQQLIEDHGGIVKKIDRWGKRRLAYSINKKTHASYVEIEFSANSRLNIPNILEGEFRLNDRVLRALTYMIEKNELMQRQRNAGKTAARSKQEEIRTKEKTVKITQEVQEEISEEPKIESLEKEVPDFDEAYPDEPSLEDPKKADSDQA
jgi:small subunit ribosomal protein S6